MATSRRKRQCSGGNTGDHPSIQCFSFSLWTILTLGYWVLRVWLEALFPFTLWGQVKHNHFKGNSEQERSAEMHSEVLCCEPRSAPNFSSCQSHVSSLPSYPEHCLLKDEPGSGSSHGFSELTGFSLRKQEMKGCPWLLGYFLDNFLMFSIKRFMPQT